MAEWRNIPIREELLTVLEKRAHKESRSVANLVEVILRKELEVPA